MTFRDKIDKILKTNTLGINTVYKLEIHIGSSPSSIARYHKKNEEPGSATLKKLWDGMKINRAWWESGEGEIFQQDDNKKEDDPMSNPLVQQLLKQIKVYEDYIERLQADIERLKSQQ